MSAGRDPGGEFSLVMNGPDGERFEEMGVVLEVEPMRRLKTTDAFLRSTAPGGRTSLPTRPSSAERAR